MHKGRGLVLEIEVSGPGERGEIDINLTPPDASVFAAQGAVVEAGVTRKDGRYEPPPIPPADLVEIESWDNLKKASELIEEHLGTVVPKSVIHAKWAAWKLSRRSLSNVGVAQRLEPAKTVRLWLRELPK